MTLCLVPPPGQRPVRLTPRRSERVLHVCLRVPGDPQGALERALRSLTTEGGSYNEVDWAACKREGRKVSDSVHAAARHLVPTLVFMQVQTPGVLTGADVRALRHFMSPHGVVVQWNGDRREGPLHSARGWERDLGADCDATMLVCTADVEQLAATGIPAAYLQIGVDADLWRPCEPAPNTPPVVLLASCYPHLGYESRTHAARMLTQAFPGRFAAYGYGWNDSRVASRPFVTHGEEAPIYSACAAAVSSSISAYLPRYTSDRLFRCLASGALTLVESFPDMAGLGLGDGHNCLVWRNQSDLLGIVGDVLADPHAGHYQQIRQNARALALTHTWAERMGELARIVETVRAGRA